jgi:hypothetical protein
MTSDTGSLRAGLPRPKVSKFLATAAASTGLPSEKVTPERSLKVYSVAVSLTVQLSAIQGSISSVAGFW